MSLFGPPSLTPEAQNGVWQHVETQVLGSAAATVSFTGLVPADFWRIAGYMITGTSTNLDVRLNNDSGSNYQFQRLRVAHTSVTAVRDTSVTLIRLSLASTGTAARNIAIAVIGKPSSGVRAQLLSMAGIQVAASLEGGATGGEWNNTGDEITRIDVTAGAQTFAADSSIRLDRMDAA